MLIESFLNQLYFDEKSKRGTGRTTKLIEKAKELNAYFVCHDMAFAKTVQRDHPYLKVMTLRKYRERGVLPYDSKVVFDHFVEFCMIESKLKELQNFMSSSDGQ